jgi:hypothetical protein
VHVSPVSILSAVLRHHIQSKPYSFLSSSQTQQVQTIIAALEAAPTAAEKLAILEHILASEGPSSFQGPPKPTPVSAEEIDSETAWRISSKSAESMSTLQAERYGRQWEVETAIRAIFEHAQLGAADKPLPGLAMPFKPSASDMEKAIEALGYSARSLFSEELKSAGTRDDVGRNPSVSLRWLIIGVFLLAAFFVFVLS